MLFAKWLRLVDAVILETESLGATARWAVEALAAAKSESDHTVIVLLSAAAATGLTLPADWLAVPPGLAPALLQQTLTNFLQLRSAQRRLQRVETLAAPRLAVPVAPAVPPAPEAYRYREALKSISRLLSRSRGEAETLTDFLELVRDLLGVGKLAFFRRAVEEEMFGLADRGASRQLWVVASDGVGQDVAEHLRLSLATGVGGYLARTGKILQRSQLAELVAREDAPQLAREFELLGAEVAVPLFDHDQLTGVLTIGGRVTGTPMAAEELELVYHLVAQVGAALRNRQLTDQVADQQRLLSEVLAHVPTGVVVVGADQRVLHLNRRAAELLELAAADAGKLPTRVGDVLYETLRTGEEILQREVVLPRSQRVVCVSATRFAFQPAAGGAGVVVGLIEDLSELKREQQRSREEADRELFTRLSARLSHELKNALVSIKIFAQLLPERYHDAEFREQFSSTVANEVNRVDVLVNNLMFFGHPLALVCEEVSLAELLDTCLENLAGEIARAGAPDGGTAVIVKKNYTHKFATLTADKIRLQQAVEQLLRNALQAMPAGGRLIVTTADAQPEDWVGAAPPAGGGVRIEVQDTGEGIALADLPRVTEPFVTTRNVGVGLGLTIVKRIVERHGGRLQMDSMRGRGTTVTLVLPVQASAEPAHVDVRRATMVAAARPTMESEQ